MDALLEAQQKEQNPYKRQEILCKIANLLNKDVPVIYRGKKRFHVIAHKKSNDIKLAGELIDLSLAWIKGTKNNLWALRNEKEAKSPVDCSDPGDVEAVRQLILGSWKGLDSHGAAMTFDFKSDGTVTTSRGSRGGTVKYKICKDTFFYRPPGALLVGKLENGNLTGYWEYPGYKGNFTAKRVSSE